VRDIEYGQCLTDETLTDYLEGGLDPAIKAASEVHLLACDECRNQMALLMRLLEPEATPEEATQLETITARWGRKSGHKPTAGKFRFQRFFLVGAVSAAFFAVILVSAWVIQRQSSLQDSASGVVQLLLEQNRPFEARMAGEPHRKIVRTRGPDDPGVSYSLLAGEMTKLSANSHEMGRFYLLQKDFVRAISYLEIAEREVGAGAAVHNDLGVAYMESGIGSQLSRAGSEFLHALQEDQTFHAAAFNLALFYERTHETAQSAAQWRRYLELDSKSDWASEARERLQGISH
jgi:tetratricopeptide (TPR) repeat protein